MNERLNQLTVVQRQIEVVSPVGQANVSITFDYYKKPSTEQKTSRACDIVGGIASQKDDHPLPLIAGIAAELSGQSFVIAEPPYTADPTWQTVQGHREAITQAIGRISEEYAVSRVDAIGYSKGGTKVVTALGQSEPLENTQLDAILCLCSPKTENLLDSPYFRARMVETDTEFVLGRRQRSVPKNYLSGGLAGDVVQAINTLNSRGISITSLGIEGDEIVPEPLSGEGVHRFNRILDTNGLRPPDIHLWKGEKNAKILETEIINFLNHGQEPIILDLT